ncbi:hypothetical protein BX070DRAFT_153806 [Coemansia spiralis]|nr:hypothetical protein BX070DRAFT_153806 [Coemansia spiralis]
MIWWRGGQMPPYLNHLPDRQKSVLTLRPSGCPKGGGKVSFFERKDAKGCGQEHVASSPATTTTTATTIHSREASCAVVLGIDGWPRYFEILLYWEIITKLRKRFHISLLWSIVLPLPILSAKLCCCDADGFSAGGRYRRKASSLDARIGSGEIQMHNGGGERGGDRDWVTCPPPSSFQPNLYSLAHAPPILYFSAFVGQAESKKYARKPRCSSASSLPKTGAIVSCYLNTCMLCMRPSPYHIYFLPLRLFLYACVFSSGWHA